MTYHLLQFNTTISVIKSLGKGLFTSHTQPFSLPKSIFLGCDDGKHSKKALMKTNTRARALFAKRIKTVCDSKYSTDDVEQTYIRTHVYSSEKYKKQEEEEGEKNSSK